MKEMDAHMRLVQASERQRRIDRIKQETLVEPLSESEIHATLNYHGTKVKVARKHGEMFIVHVIPYRPLDEAHEKVFFEIAAEAMDDFRAKAERAEQEIDLG